MVAPKRSACSRNLRHQLRALDAIGEAGVVLDVGGDHELAHRHVAGDDERLEVGARGVDGGGEAGRAGADDHDLRAMPASVVGRRRGCPSSGGTVVVMRRQV